jgi:hypothetical protein
LFGKFGVADVSDFELFFWEIWFITCFPINAVMEFDEKGEGLQDIRYEKSCSAQLVMAALNEESDIGPTLTEFLDSYFFP